MTIQIEEGVSWLEMLFPFRFGLARADGYLLRQEIRKGRESHLHFP